MIRKVRTATTTAGRYRCNRRTRLASAKPSSHKLCCIVPIPDNYQTSHTHESVRSGKLCRWRHYRALTMIAMSVCFRRKHGRMVLCDKCPARVSDRFFKSRRQYTDAIGRVHDRHSAGRAGDAKLIDWMRTCRERLGQPHQGCISSNTCMNVW
jgi:hypothetical protein